MSEETGRKIKSIKKNYLEYKERLQSLFEGEELIAQMTLNLNVSKSLIFLAIMEDKTI